jgi:DNA-binding PadR family transcriptional regulator
VYTLTESGKMEARRRRTKVTVVTGMLDAGKKEVKKKRLRYW